MCGNWQVFLILQCFLFFIVICFVTYWLIYLFIYFLLCINVVNLLSTIKKNVWNHVRSVYFSDGGSRDRDIIFIDRRYLVFCFLGCVVKFQAREANSRRRGTSSNPCNWVCVLFLFLSFLFFFFLPTFSIFSRSNAHRHSHNQGRCKETWKGRKETLESSLLHSICGLQINVWLRAFI